MIKNCARIWLFLLVISCHSQQQVASSKRSNLRMKGDSLGIQDPKVLALIKPYKLILDSQMNIRIMVADEDIKKEQPEGALGNMVCDVLMAYMQAKGETPDFCIMNNGGLRIPTLYKGDVTVRTIYELMPFENQLVLLTLTGAKCKELCNTIAQNNGAPVSGLRMKIKNGEASQLTIQGKDWNETQTYKVLTSDYLANGGDKADALKNPIQMLDLNVKIREALIQQLKSMFYSGQTLQAKKDGRISYE